MTDTQRVVGGIDLVKVSVIQSSLDQFGKRFLDRIFTPHEIEYSLSSPHSAAERLAARFAAKEACRKILLSDDQGIGWRSVEVRRSSDGACELVLHQEALERASAAGLSGWSVSMSHEDEYAAAIVIAIRQGGSGRNT